MRCFVALKFMVILLLSSLDVTSQLNAEPRTANLPLCIDKSLLTTTRLAVWGRKSKAYVRDLTEENFLVSKGSTNYSLKCFSPMDTPLAVGFLIDYSSSEKQESIAAAFKGIEHFIKTSNELSTFLAVGFSSKPFLQLEPTNDRNQIEAFLAAAVNLKPTGNSSFNDAMHMALDSLSTENAKKKVLVVFSNGEDNFSKNGSLDKLHQRLRTEGVRLYFVTYRDSRESTDTDTEFRREFLGRIALESAGVFYALDYGRPNIEFIEGIVRKLRNEYTIGFNLGKPTQKWHEATFAVKLPMSFELVNIIGPRKVFH